MVTIYLLVLFSILKTLKNPSLLCIISRMRILLLLLVAQLIVAVMCGVQIENEKNLTIF